jgi:hypothetical protein
MPGGDGKPSLPVGLTTIGSTMPVRLTLLASRSSASGSMCLRALRPFSTSMVETSSSGVSN